MAVDFEGEESSEPSAALILVVGKPGGTLGLNIDDATAEGGEPRISPAIDCTPIPLPPPSPSSLVPPT
eukprot:CAMPEP_0178519124 /NCGR_PEP_ID=MMETSP0696-20121128/26656_1 /TAXON_ID=265572 /ORGANISM="Extubocellulus spinifer, Strain CCMP396" /LENGTH=67 /DNA_ID=CAMNT_0020149799 /DNA_START=87 /DNA_END=286 /DNA_ORIENTATION=-